MSTNYKPRKKNSKPVTKTWINKKNGIKYEKSISKVNNKKKQVLIKTKEDGSKEVATIRIKPNGEFEKTVKFENNTGYRVKSERNYTKIGDLKEVVKTYKSIDGDMAVQRPLFEMVDKFRGKKLTERKMKTNMVGESDRNFYRTSQVSYIKEGYCDKYKKTTIISGNDMDSIVQSVDNKYKVDNRKKVAKRIHSIIRKKDQFTDGGKVMTTIAKLVPAEKANLTNGFNF